VCVALAAVALITCLAATELFDSGELARVDEAPVEVAAPVGDFAPRPDADPDAECELPWVDRSITTSSDCLTCHGALSNIVCYAPTCEPMRLHPVGAVYDESRHRLRPRSQLSSALPLVNGRVECTTCHDGNSELPANLAQRRLCFGCHDY
jgi:hypothetical protein